MALLERVGRVPRAAALAGALAIAFSGITYRWSEVSPATGVVFRCLYGLPLLILAARAESARLGPMDRRTWRMSALAGAFFGLDLLTYHYVVDDMGAGLATVMGNLQVVLVALGAWLLWRERPRREVLAAIPVMLVGVVLISGLVGSDAYGVNPARGVAIGLVTATAYTGYLLVIRRASSDRRSAGPVAIASAVTALVAGLAGAALGDLDLVPSWPAHGFLVLLGLGSQSIGYLVIQVSLPRLPAALASVLLLAQSVASLALAALLLGEDPSGWQLAGVVLVIGGIALATGTLRRLRAGLGARTGAGGSAAAA